MTMTWNENKQAYYGTTSDGKIVEVAGDEFAESLRDGIQAFIENQSRVDLGGETFEGSPADLLERYPALYEKYENLTLIDLGDPELWAVLVGDNPNVEFVEEA